MKNSKNKKKNKLFYNILSVVLLIVSVIFLSYLFYISILPSKYFNLLFIIIAAFSMFNILMLRLPRLKKKIKNAISVISIIYILVVSLMNFYLFRTVSVLNSNGESKYKVENYSVIVLKSSNYKKINDIKNEEVGYYKGSASSEKANKEIKSKVNIELKQYDSSDLLANALLNGEVNVIVMEDTIKSIMEEEIEEFKNNTRVIYTFKIKTKSDIITKDVDVTKKPFAVYISGIDTYGEISSVSRSDVNIVMFVNPKINQVLLISIPRDYYVQLHGTTGLKDKLTHAGIYGTDMSIRTIEDLLDININYYVKVNFTSTIDIVDALGGVDVYSDYSFISYSNFSFKQGYNSVNGEQALDFARTRKAFSDGDRQRGKNQQALIEAIIRKATSKSIITKYNSLLSAVDGKYQTNMSLKKITSLIKQQLNDMNSWNVTSYSLTGKDSSNYTYTYNQLLYVMEPDIDSLSEAKKMIDSVMNGEKLDSSYSNSIGKSSQVTKVKPQVEVSNKSNVKTNNEDEIKKAKIVNIKFLSDGKLIYQKEINENSKVLEPEELEKEGYIFIGWYLNDELYDFNETVKEDLTLVAKWQEKQLQEEDEDTNQEEENNIQN